MQVSRLTFTKETKDKMNKPLNHFQRGELRWKRIKELSENGRLGQARNRMDLVEMLGAVRGYNAVYTWVSSMITKGYLRETMTGIGKDGKMENEYSVIKSPSFSAADRTKKMREAKQKKNETLVRPVVTPVAIVNDGAMARVVVRYKDLTIELENIDRATVSDIIERLATIAG